MEMIEILGGLAATHPRLAGVLVALGALLSAVGLVCAQIDADALAVQGHPTAARWVRWGQQVGALAVALSRSSRRGGDGPR